MDAQPQPAANLTVVTRLKLVREARAVAARRSAAIPLRRLSPLLRYLLTTAAPRPDGRPPLLPDFAPPRCGHNLWQCWNDVRWVVRDRTNMVLFCQKHFDLFADAHDVIDFKIDRYER